MKHNDCKYYLPIDAFKGICKRDKNNINADDESCEHFEKARKCEHCSHFELTGDEIGICNEKYDAYPKMNALTCTDFQWN